LYRNWCIYYFNKCLTCISKTKFSFMGSLNNAPRELVCMTLNIFVTKQGLLHMMYVVQTFYTMQSNSKTKWKETTKSLDKLVRKKTEINTYTCCKVAWYNMLPKASVIFDTWRTLNLFSNRCLKAFIRPMKAKSMVGMLDIVL